MLRRKYLQGHQEWSLHNTNSKTTLNMFIKAYFMMEAKTYLLNIHNYSFLARMIFQLDKSNKSEHCLKFTSEINALIQSLLLVSLGFTIKTKKIGLMFPISLMFSPVILSQKAKDRGKVFIAPQLLLGKWVYLIVIIFILTCFPTLQGLNGFL